MWVKLKKDIRNLNRVPFTLFINVFIEAANHYPHNLILMNKQVVKLNKNQNLKIKILNKQYSVILFRCSLNCSSFTNRSMTITQQTFVGIQDVLKTSSIRLQINNFSSSKLSWRHLARRLEDMNLKRLQDIFLTNKFFSGDIVSDKSK